LSAEENDLLAGLDLNEPAVEVAPPPGLEDEVQGPVKPKRGPKSRADIEAELRAKIEAETAARVEAEVRARIEAEYAEKEREAAEARALAAEARPIAGREIDGDPTDENAVTVHFVEDGLTLLGKVWFRGEELTVNPGTRQWEEVQVVLKGGSKRNLLTLDEDEQIDRWGKRFFREGLWRGKRLTDIDDPELSDEERAALKKAQQIRDEKYGKVATT
jgi:hypothetical protein